MTYWFLIIAMINGYMLEVGKYPSKEECEKAGIAAKEIYHKHTNTRNYVFGFTCIPRR